MEYKPKTSKKVESNCKTVPEEILRNSEKDNNVLFEFACVFD